MHGDCYTLNYSCYLFSISPYVRLNLLDHDPAHLDGSVTGRSVLAVALVRPIGLWLDLLDTWERSWVLVILPDERNAYLPLAGLLR